MYGLASIEHDGGMYLSTARARQRPDLFVAERLAGYERPKPTVYLDTTIPSYLTAPMSANIANARRQRITRVWWSRYRENFTICISDLLLTEAAAGRPEAAQERLHALENIDAVRLIHRSDDLFASLAKDALIPPKSWADAKHIAIAAANSVQFLLTWNYKHLANRTIRREIARRCEALHFRCPEICTPEELMRTSAHERHSY